MPAAGELMPRRRSYRKLQWDATAWETGEVVGATTQTPVLREIGGDLLLVLVNESGAITVTRSDDAATWSNEPNVTMKVGHDVGVSAVATKSSILIATLGG